VETESRSAAAEEQEEKSGRVEGWPATVFEA
jgi:hypothetical protein